MVEPLGSFAEIDLYLTYSDLGKGSDPQLEIRHMFELPAGSTAKDLWLWIGDSVMQAKIMKTADAQAIYDRITLARRDPAILTVKDGQYDLRVYPLAPASTRKVKISFIMPREEKLGRFSLPLPLAMLKANAASSKPLKILFRSRKNAWPVPRFPPAKDMGFLKVKDSAGTAYHETLASDITGFSSLALEFSPPWNQGSLVNSRATGDSMLVQLGIDPDSLFGLSASVKAPRRISIGFDWSGPFKEGDSPLLPMVADLVSGIVSPGDSLHFVAASDSGIGFSSQPGWAAATEVGIKELISAIGGSKMAKDKLGRKEPVVLICDPLAASTYPILHEDKDAVTQVVDSKGRPVVVEKRIGEGRLVVSGIWTFRDGGGGNKITSSPLLRMHAFGSAGALPALMDAMRLADAINAPTDFLLLSNGAGNAADSIGSPLARRLLPAVANGLAPVSALNLTTDETYQPYRQSIPQGEAYGRGNILHELARLTHGDYFDVGKTPMDQILQRLAPQKSARIDSISTEAKSGNNGTPIRLGEEFNYRNDGFGSRFFLGYIHPSERIEFKVNAKITGEAGFRTKEFSYTPEPLSAIA